MSERRHLRAVGPAGDIPDGELTERVEPTEQERQALADHLRSGGLRPFRSAVGPGPRQSGGIARRLWALAAYEQLLEWRR